MFKNPTPWIIGLILVVYLLISLLKPQWIIEFFNVFTWLPKNKGKF